VKIRRPRVAITRDEERDGPLARALRDEGLEPVPCRAVKVVPPPALGLVERAARSLERYDWLVVASRRAVAAVVEARRGRPLPARLRTAAVGESTAAALRQAGARSVLVGTESGVRGLLPWLAGADDWRGRAVLLPRAAQGSRLLAETLIGLGAHVDEVVAYCTSPRSLAEIAGSWKKARPDAAVITSPSAAEALVRALGTAPLRHLSAVVAIGPTTAGALARLGVPALVSPLADFTSAALRTRHALQETAAAAPKRGRS
jgi:uroporphyrinogen-III synthase